MKFYISSFEEQQKIFKQRDDFLTRICFFKWHEVLPKLREKKLVVDKKYDDIVDKFRFVIYINLIILVIFWILKVILAERAFRSWKIFIQEEKKEKIKKNQKEVMWKKANNWLSEYSEQKKNLKHK